MYLVVFESVCFCLFRMRRARYAPAAEAADEDEQSFQDEVFVPAPRRRGRSSSGRGVLSHVAFAYV